MTRKNATADASGTAELAVMRLPASAATGGTPLDDNLNGTREGDRINAEDGDDRVHGRGGDDTLFGGNGDDVLVGGFGADQLYGDAGHDRLSGGDNFDILIGGAGRDVLIGGAAGDAFVFGDGDGTDRILDYNGRQDIIEIHSAGITDVSQLEITTRGNAAAITWEGAGTVILVEGHANYVFTSADFLFEPPAAALTADILTI